jgi:cytidylate kinase
MKTKEHIIITIDGPAGAGKSTIARLLAKKLRFDYLDTGGLYRAITLKALEDEISLKNTGAIVRHILNSDIKFRGGGKTIFMDGKDVSRKIRTDRITASVYKIAVSKKVREAMKKLQRKLAQKKNIVCEGRDMGSVVFPDARLKFYLDASLKERTRRRYSELQKLFPWKQFQYSQILKEISLRDYRDKHRKIAPLIQPAGAFYIDTSDLSIPQVVNKLYTIVVDEISKIF